MITKINFNLISKFVITFLLLVIIFWTSISNATSHNTRERKVYFDDSITTKNKTIYFSDSSATEIEIPIYLESTPGNFKSSGIRSALWMNGAYFSLAETPTQNIETDSNQVASGAWKELDDFYQEGVSVNHRLSPVLVKRTESFDVAVTPIIEETNRLYSISWDYYGDTGLWPYDYTYGSCSVFPTIITTRNVCTLLSGIWTETIIDTTKRFLLGTYRFKIRPNSISTFDGSLSTKVEIITRKGTNDGPIEGIRLVATDFEISSSVLTIVFGPEPVPNQAPTILDKTATVNENVPSGTAVTTIIGTDPEGDTLTYSIKEGNTNDAFAIDSSSGVITVNGDNKIDFETTPSYSLTIVASDGDLIDTATITITVIDVNDAPIITGEETITITINENQRDVTNVESTDVDTNDNGDTFLTTLTGEDNSKFTITTDGVLTFIDAPDFENPADNNANNEYIVIVTADDGNGGTDLQIIKVTVTNVENEDSRLLLDVDGDGRISEADIRSLFFRAQLASFSSFDYLGKTDSRSIELETQYQNILNSPLLDINGDDLTDESEIRAFFFRAQLASFSAFDYLGKTDSRSIELENQYNDILD